MKTIREHLGAKLFIANLVVVLVGIMVLMLIVQLTIPAAFNRHMAMMEGEAMMGNGMGMGQIGRAHV